MHSKLTLFSILVVISELVTADVNLLPDKNNCGIQIANKDLSTTNKAALGDFPWLVSLRYISNKTGKAVGAKCAGSLINSRYVLTSTVCVTNDVYLVSEVRLGDYNTSTDPDCVGESCNDPAKDFGIEEIIPNHLFSAKEKNNDIALLRLDKEVVFTDYIRPICLDLNGLIKENSTVVTSGWGVTLSGQQSTIMKKVTSTVITNEECMKIYKYQVNITEDQFCSQRLVNSVDGTCAGDAGGPVMYLKDYQWFQVGIVSFGNLCWKTDATEAQTKVSNYIGWITENIKS